MDLGFGLGMDMATVDLSFRFEMVLIDLFISLSLWCMMVMAVHFCKNKKTMVMVVDFMEI